MGNNLVVEAEWKWEEKPGNGWLLAEVYDLLLRDGLEPLDLTLMDNGGSMDSQIRLEEVER